MATVKFSLVPFLKEEAHMKSNYSKPLANAYKAILKENGINYAFDKSSGCFVFTMSLKKGIINSLEYRVEIMSAAIFIVAECPVGVNPNKRVLLRSMMEFITRVNKAIRTGNFDLDCGQGILSYRLFLDCEKHVPSKESLQRSTNVPKTMFELFSDGIMDTILGAEAKIAFECALEVYYQRIRELMQDGDDQANILLEEIGLTEELFEEEKIDIQECFASLPTDIFED